MFSKTDSELSFAIITIGFSEKLIVEFTTGLKRRKAKILTTIVRKINNAQRRYFELNEFSFL
jgi:hypothetical protein